MGRFKISWVLNGLFCVIGILFTLISCGKNDKIKFNILEADKIRSIELNLYDSAFGLKKGSYIPIGLLNGLILSLNKMESENSQKELISKGIIIFKQYGGDDLKLSLFTNSKGSLLFFYQNNYFLGNIKFSDFFRETIKFNNMLDTNNITSIGLKLNASYLGLEGGAYIPFSDKLNDLMIFLDKMEEVYNQSKLLHFGLITIKQKGGDDLKIDLFSNSKGNLLFFRCQHIYFQGNFKIFGFFNKN